jgi:hypothetical protein
MRHEFRSFLAAASNRPQRRLLAQVTTGSAACVILAVVLLSTACGGSGASPGQSPPPTAPPPTAAVPPPTIHTHGRFIGTVTIGDTRYFGDALVTMDGAIRLFVGGPGSNTGVLQMSKPETSELLVGTITVQGTEIGGTGVISGLECASSNAPSLYCGQDAAAEIHVSVTSGNLSGDIRPAAGGPGATWFLDLQYWPNYYEEPVGAGGGGNYQEGIAEFSSNGDTIIHVDPSGSLFFQSVSSGCVGNGLMSPHLDGKFGVWDVSLVLASCNPPYAYLNGEYHGLAAMSAGNYWDYDNVLRMWLSSTAAEPTAPALVLLAPQLY